MSQIKQLEQAKMSTLSRNNSDFGAKRIVLNRGESANTIELLQDLIDSPSGNTGTSSNNVLTRLTHPEAIEPGETFPDQIGEEKHLMTAKNPPRNLWRIIALCVWAGAGGWSDAAPGALLPHIENYYNINYSVVSLIWMANAAGFILVAMLSHKIQPWLGKRLSMVSGCALSLVMYAIVSSGTKFPLIVVGFFFGGMGLAICLAQTNVFLARLDKLSTYLSFCHGSYGLGATVSPLIGTSMVNRGIQWHFFYLILLGYTIFNVIDFIFAFKGADHDLKPWDTDDTIESTAPSNDTNGASVEFESAIGLQSLNNGGHNTNETPKDVSSLSHGSDMILALKNYNTWLIALFVFFYQGSEVSFAGWIVTYLLDYRKGNSSLVGYVASGFWGGLTLGRLLLTRFVHKEMGARRGVIILSLTAILLAILTWIIPNPVVAGVLASLAGIAIGPNYPLQITLTTRLIPRKIQVISLTIITAFGSSGGAIFPFIVGLVSQTAGTFVVLPIFIALYSIMLFLWICLPNVERHVVPGKKLNFWQKLW